MDCSKNAVLCVQLSVSKSNFTASDMDMICFSAVDLFWVKICGDCFYFDLNKLQKNRVEEKKRALNVIPSDDPISMAWAFVFIRINPWKIDRDLKVISVI